ncbi:transcriptional regulator [Geothermobacter hydrogeniphilus]|uniref:Transcriptional regulator n=1 Tax=Geothermobacter hydrogeniphilus TaxID=1969733 RepID=A0A2K2H8B9_9BACT|nr:helix-turn-helix domain-containing protein [Geothermobacter hydrogeniphilus]PNU19489.1 transcriptional regulator [Geothermobacter hydrogeniphilus]
MNAEPSLAGQEQPWQSPDYSCPVAVTLDIIGGKWKAVILWHLSFRTLRFSQLRRRVKGITQKMLTQQLRELERDGLVHREIYAEVPPRVEYSLTDEGRTLKPMLSGMCNWGREHMRRVGLQPPQPCLPPD